MTAPLDYQSPSTRPTWTESGLYLLILKAMAGYFAISLLTLPFIDKWWTGRLPMLALIQLPKTALAQWLIRHVAMPTMSILGLSRGSFSPDYLLARPYALAAAYLIPLVLVLLIVWVRTRMSGLLRTWACFLVVLAIIDFLYTLQFAEYHGLTIY